MSSRLSTSESPRQAYWFGAAFFCIVVSIFLAACGANEPEDREGGTLLSWTESTRRLLHRPSASIQVSPSGQDQVLTVLGVGVTIPGALLGTPAVERDGAVGCEPEQTDARDADRRCL